MASTSVKIAVLGGSAVGTPELSAALVRHATTQTPLELVLHGRTVEKLAPVARATALLAQGHDWLTVRSTTELAEALEGADYIINQVRIGGLQARVFDETFPITLGLPGEETVGAGGFANAVRTVPAVVEIARQIERRAPDALLLSFTNPASVIQYAVQHTTPKLRVIGLCDAPVTMTGWAAQALDAPPDELSVDYIGMHHFGFLTRVVRDGRDVTGDMLANLERVPGLDIDLDIVRHLGALPTPYWRYFVHADRMLAKQRGQTQTRAEQLMAIEAELLGAYAQGQPESVARRSAKWYDVIIAPVLMALIERRRASFIINVTNREAIPWLPHSAIIETNCLLEAGTIRPLSLPTPNAELQARIALNCAYEQMLVSAILSQDATLAVRALTLNPMIGGVALARQIVERTFPDGGAERTQHSL